MVDTETSVDLSDVIDLSVIELYILNYLIRIAGSVVRFSVFNDINNQLPEKAISRSSFYNSLENLEKKGFVEIESTTKGRKSAVRALPKAKLAIKQVNIFNIWGSVDPDTKFKTLIQNSSSLFKGQENDIQLIVSLQYPANQEIIELLSRDYQNFKLLGNESTIGPIFEPYDLVDTDEKGIVERNSMFKQVIIYRYAYNEILFDFDFTTLVEEAFRVVQPGGTIVFFALEDLRSTSNLILESGIGTVLQNTLEQQSTDKLYEILKEIQNKPTVGKEIREIKKHSSDGLSMVIVNL